MAVQMFLREMLESKGYRTLGAINGQKAYEILTSSSRVDLVLSDYHMPDSNGYELLKKLRDNEKTNQMPVIFLTAEANPEIMAMNKQLGYSAWIKKPYRAELLFQEIKKILPLNSIQWNLFSVM